jgi:hypothetical protein
MYIECWPLPSLRDFAHVGVLCTCTHLVIHTSSWDRYKLAAEQLLGRAGGTVHHCSRTANEGLVRIQYKCLVPIYVFLEMKLCGGVLSANFHIRVLVSVNDLYFPTISLLRTDSGNRGRTVSFLGRHVSNFRYSAVRYDPPITVQIAPPPSTPLIQPVSEGRRVGPIIYGSWPLCLQLSIFSQNFNLARELQPHIARVCVYPSTIPARPIKQELLSIFLPMVLQFFPY